MNIEVERIYAKNNNIINLIIGNILDIQPDSMRRFVPCPMLIDDITEYIKQKIEDRLKIEDLYPEHMKEEALNRLPIYIRELRR